MKFKSNIYKTINFLAIKELLKVDDIGKVEELPVPLCNTSLLYKEIHACSLVQHH
jgi:hypothetical protein